jgi:arginine-tRNA-protein transferase
MKQRLVQSTRFFFATAPMPCPYLAGRVERRLVTELAGRHSISFHDVLSQAGFRRSHSIAYVPVCSECDACAAVRIVVPQFTPSRTQRRVWIRNGDIIGTEGPARATEEQYTLFRAYQKARHRDGEMARMDYYDYQTMIEDTPVDTLMVEFRDPEDTLLAACLTDRVADGFSAVYSFYDPNLARRGLGTFMILWLVERARALGRSFVYLGFWVRNSPKMSYKSRFKPLERYQPTGWTLLETD